MRRRAVTVLAGATALVAVLARPTFAAGGDLDPSFGDNGTVVTTGDRGHVQDRDAVLTPGGSTLALFATFSKDASTSRGVVERFDAAGRLDPTYGRSGRAAVGVPNFLPIMLVQRGSGLLVLGGLASGEDGFADPLDHAQCTRIDRSACGGTSTRTTSPSR